MCRKISNSLLFAVLLGMACTVSAKTFTIVGENDLRFSKAHIEVAPGESVTIKLTNPSKLPASVMAHNWVLLKPGTDDLKFARIAADAEKQDYIPRSLSDKIIAHTGLVAGGESDSVTFTAPQKPGDYEYICSFPHHLAAGMKGTLTVRKPQ